MVTTCIVSSIIKYFAGKTYSTGTICITTRGKADETEL